MAKVDAEVAVVDAEQQRTDWSEEIFRDKENYRVGSDDAYQGENEGKGDSDSEGKGEDEGEDLDDDDDEGDNNVSWAEFDVVDQGAKNGYLSDEGLGEEPM